MALLPNIVSEDFVAINHSCGQSQVRKSVKKAVRPVACRQGMQSYSLESGRQVEQILVLLISRLPARSKELQLLFAVTQLFVDIRFNLED